MTVNEVKNTLCCLWWYQVQDSQEMILMSILVPWLKTWENYGLKGFISSEARPSLRFLVSCPNFGYNWLIFSHYGESIGCWRKPSIILPFACHRRYFASFALANNLLNIGIIGRYQQTFVGRFFFSASIIIALVIVQFVTWYPTCWAIVHFCKLISVQNTIIRTCMNFLVLYTHETQYFLCLVVTLR